MERLSKRSSPCDAWLYIKWILAEQKDSTRLTNPKGSHNRQVWRDIFEKMSEILNKCSLNLILLIRDQVASQAKKSKSLDWDKGGHTKRKVSANDSSVKDTVSKYKEKLLTIKLKNYKRDTEDLSMGSPGTGDTSCCSNPAPFMHEKEYYLYTPTGGVPGGLPKPESHFTFDSDSDNTPSTSWSLCVICWSLHHLPSYLRDSSDFTLKWEIYLMKPVYWLWTLQAFTPTFLMKEA